MKSKLSTPSTTTDNTFLAVLNGSLTNKPSHFDPETEYPKLAANTSDTDSEGKLLDPLKSIDLGEFKTMNSLQLTKIDEIMLLQ